MGNGHSLSRWYYNLIKGCPFFSSRVRATG
jgi:hypothetical protein